MIRCNFLQSLKKLYGGGSEPPYPFENLNLRVFLTGHTVAMVTYCATKSAATCSPMIGQFFFDTMILVSTDIEWL